MKIYDAVLWDATSENLEDVIPPGWDIFQMFLIKTGVIEENEYETYRIILVKTIK